MPDGPPIRASSWVLRFHADRAATAGDGRSVSVSESPSPSACGLRTCGRRGCAVPSVLRTTRREQLETTVGPRRPSAARTPVGIVHPRLDDPMRRHDSDDRRLIRSTDPETGVASGLPEAAMCVQDIDVQCVLQFTLIHAAGCALHRLTSRVIHRLELSV